MYKKCAIEFIGSIFFIFVVIATRAAIPIGLALMLCILIGGNISGGHFNPAVTIAMTLNNKIAPKQAMMYIIAQILGGISGVLLHKLVL